MHANSSRIGVAPRFVARQGGLTRGVTAGEVDDTGSAGAVGDAGGQCTKGLGQLAGTAPATDIHALIKTTMSQCCSPVNSTVMPFWLARLALRCARDPFDLLRFDEVVG
jgi:hypothetical protein